MIAAAISNMRIVKLAMLEAESAAHPSGAAAHRRLLPPLRRDRVMSRRRTCRGSAARPPDVGATMMWNEGRQKKVRLPVDPPLGAC